MEIVEKVKKVKKVKIGRNNILYSKSEKSENSQSPVLHKVKIVN